MVVLGGAVTRPVWIVREPLRRTGKFQKRPVAVGFRDQHQPNRCVRRETHRLIGNENLAVKMGTNRGHHVAEYNILRPATQSDA